MSEVIEELTSDPPQRARFYNEHFPNRPPLAFTAEWVTGAWCIGNYYKNPNPLYGAYPHGYLERVHSMFPDARRVLHVFSGGLVWDMAVKVAWPELTDGVILSPEWLELKDRVVELVDLHGSEQGRNPTWQGDVLDLPGEWKGRFDLVLADPPYSAVDAERYDVPMINRAAVMRALREVCKCGGNLIWLDQVWPMHRKSEWKTWGHIGLVRSTNHRVRLVSVFEAVV